MPRREVLGTMPKLVPDKILTCKSRLLLTFLTEARDPAEVLMLLVNETTQYFEGPYSMRCWVEYDSLVIEVTSL